jgi:trehalose synthase
MIRIIDVDEALTIADYEAIPQLTPAVLEMLNEAALLSPRFEGRTVWMVNSTEAGGGVAEMLPRMVSMLREMGINTQWVVAGTEETSFFDLTKRIHNMVHGMGDPDSLTDQDQALYARVSRECADEMKGHLGPRDILVIHDPQPCGMGALIKKETGLTSIWRCHIGYDGRVPATSAVWRFLEPHAGVYDHAIFSAPEYIPNFLAGRASIIHPALDPLGHKNRDLSPHKLMGILCNAGLAVEHAPVLTFPFKHRVQRLLPDGRWTPALDSGDLGLPYRPVITQISRWDRLKGYAPLLEAFVKLKLQQPNDKVSKRHRRRLSLLRLILAGPDPSAVEDDPEGKEVLEELSQKYLELDPPLQRNVLLLALPMVSRKENALMVNALQRCATVVVQNSVREGFGLTATEAMWKRTPVVGTHACGLRQQIRDGLDGRLVPDANDAEGVAQVLDELLSNQAERDLLALNGQRRVNKDFLIFTQLRRWMQELAAHVAD